MLDHEFSEDYDHEEEEGDMDINGEPLFEEELANQIAAGVKVGAEQKWSALWTRVHRDFHERKKFPPYQMQSKHGWVSLSKRWRVIQQECTKFYATYESIKAHPVSGLGMKHMVFQALEAFKFQHDYKAFHLSHCCTIINGEEKFKVQYAALLARREKEGVEDHGDRGEAPARKGRANERLQGKPNEEARDGPKGQAKMLELEEAKQAKMIEIEATNAKTKAKEVALASMETGVEIMKVRLNTVLPRNRLWFEKMQAKMLKFDQL
ncbi:Lectin-domain containing receptor kinase A4.3 [Hordeum vulgare]|nr:Lectin-domain containing receptor kinase A4.3 [Hordeum vulgare]